jgi:hypothetical protein
MIDFHLQDPSLESQWRAIILFGKNSASYKFAFAKSLLELADKERTSISLEELSEPFSRHIIEHLKVNDKQGTSHSSHFLESCRKFINNEIKKDELLDQTEKLGFVNVVDAFQIVNRDRIPNPFYSKDYNGKQKKIVITDELLKLKESIQFENFSGEVEARWKLVQTAWNLNLNPILLEVNYDQDKCLFFIETNEVRRTNVTSSRDSLNGYQKGKCFYCCRNISIILSSENLCDVDHFLPFIYKIYLKPTNIDGIWNLVLACSNCNGAAEKWAKVPEPKYLTRLFKRNEYFIESHHPLAETLINQTGNTKEQRKSFLEKHYNKALSYSIHKWKPKEELECSF